MENLYGQSSEDPYVALSDIISNMLSQVRPGKKPEKSARLLEIFQQAGVAGADQASLLSFLSYKSDGEHKLSAFIGHLNDRYLKAEGLHIESVISGFGSSNSTVIYRVVRNSKN